MTEFPSAIEYDETETYEVQTADASESPFSWEMRVMLVSAVWMLPGFVFGVLVRLCFPDGGPAELWLFSGGMAGAIVGGFLEADHWFS